MRRRLPRPLRRAVTVLVGLLVVEYLVLPQLAGARKALHLLARVNLAYLLAGLVLEGAAIVAYAQLTRTVLPRDGRPTLWRTLRIDLSTLAVSHLVPGGSAAGASLGYRLLADTGQRPADAGFALATQGLGSAVVLNVLLWLGLLVSIPARGFDPLYGTAALIGALLIGGFSAVVVLLARGEERALQATRAVAGRLPFLDEQRAVVLVGRLAERVQALLADRPLVLRAIGWATANWLLDAASLWVFVAAFGHRVPVDGLIVSFGLAYVLAAVPVTPGGLGVVETVLTSSLVGFGTARGVAILGVISYRLVNFWLPIPAGAASYLSLKAASTADERHEARHRARRSAELREVAAASLVTAEDRRRWAERHGLRTPERPERADR